MNPGEFDQIVTFRELTEVQDDNGQLVSTVDDFDVRARVKVLPAPETEKAGKKVERNKIRIKLWRGRSIHQDMQVLWQEKLFEITDIPMSSQRDLYRYVYAEQL